MSLLENTYFQTNHFGLVPMLGTHSDQQLHSITMKANEVAAKSVLAPGTIVPCRVKPLTNSRNPFLQTWRANLMLVNLLYLSYVCHTFVSHLLHLTLRERCVMICLWVYSLCNITLYNIASHKAPATAQMISCSCDELRRTYINWWTQSHINAICSNLNNNL